MIVKTDGSFAALVATLSLSSPGVRQQGQHCRDPPGPRQLAGLQHTPAVSVCLTITCIKCPSSLHTSPDSVTRVSL